MRYILIVLILTSLLFPGCCSDRETRCVSINKTYVVAYNNNDAEPVPAKQTEVYGEALLLELNLDRHLAACYQESTKSFFNAAYASSCKKFTEFHFSDSVTYVAISADKDYDEQHPAGAELNEYFKMPDASEFNQGNEMTSTRMYALKGPEQNGAYVYTVKVLLADGTLIEAATEPVNIIK